MHFTVEHVDELVAFSAVLEEECELHKMAIGDEIMGFVNLGFHEHFLTFGTEHEVSLQFVQHAQAITYR